MIRKTLLLVVWLTTSCMWWYEREVPHEPPPKVKLPIKVGVILTYNETGDSLPQIVYDGIMAAANDVRIEHHIVPLDSIELVHTYVELATDVNTIAILGPLHSKACKWISPLSQTYELPTITPTAVDPRIPTLSSYLYKLYRSTWAQMVKLAEYAILTCDIHKFVAIIPSDRYGNLLLETFRQTVDTLGGEIVKIFRYDTKMLEDGSLKTTLHYELEDLIYEGILIVGYVSIMRPLAYAVWGSGAIKEGVTILSNNVWTVRELRDIPGVDNTIFAALPWEVKNKNPFWITGYTAMQIVEDALQSGISTRGKLKEWLDTHMNESLPYGLGLSMQVVVPQLHIYTLREGQIVKLW
ncbi:hypothetical protein CGW93_02530 [candidate division bacterium WOR-3 4484_18]|uniref:Receptor ligand binding region domain-containing protein n=1 Tax=candidate division WOR-3 bacterium 4484_18 TaxID=2020626 RepID=A0A257LTU3_UNCW3|nr:MAG: hypothetical protein CGW93_02530 [candidate division bacterium WOR-3 4484_18]